MSEFMNAINDLVSEKGIPKEVIMEAIESALVSAYKKNYGTAANVRVEMNENTGEVEVLMQKNVVEEVEDDSTEISLEEALEIDPRYQVDDVVEYQVTPRDFGRIAAQTAKQVVVQRLREAERGMVFDNYISRQGDLITGIVQRISNQTIFVNIGNTEGILVKGERAAGERYKVNDRIKAYIMDVRKSAKGPQIFLSRTHPGFVERLFELEVPEIEDGDVVIKSIAREAGSRTKIAVYTEDEDIDPVGACVGQNGSRVRNIVDELWGEKIDITTWDEDPAVLISNVLSPAKVEEVMIDEEERAATVVVPDYQLSLAIGKEGQNVRLAARLCGWKIDIKSHTQYFGEDEEYEDDEYYDDDEYYEEEYIEEAEEETEEEAEEAEEAVKEEAEDEK
ncbi:MAG: transcription termination factor NusA [Clostridia bacterium]|nr:transcription termination factor NusA [Clostridia bacterium]